MEILRQRDHGDGEMPRRGRAHIEGSATALVPLEEDAMNT
jgi:hypothetical protein